MLDFATAKKTSQYYPGIDGLRAIAVISVIIYHFNQRILPSGFLGVDIFFVISGFVVTSSLANLPNQSWSEYLLGFYARRVKRLIPALVTNVAIAALVGCLFINPFTLESRTFLRTGMASLGGVSNLYLLKQNTDYFSVSSELNPLMHTWSLGVEEQFYVVFPLLLGLCGFGRQKSAQGLRNILLAILFLGAISLAGYFYLFHVNQSAAFFLMPSRFWELGAGCLVFVLSQKYADRIVCTRWSIDIISIGSIGVLFGIMLAPRTLQPFSTILVVFASCLSIAIVQGRNMGAAAMSNKWLVQIGLLSYSLYLWHWPAIVISHYTIGVSIQTIPMQIALIIGLALASYHLIEKPFRYKQWSDFKFKTIGYALGSLLISALLLLSLAKPLAGKLYTGDYLAAQSFQVTLAEPAIENTSLNRQNCLITTLTPSSIEKCSVSAINTPSQRIFIAGDSHGDQLTNLAGMLRQNNNFSVVSLTSRACLFPQMIYVGGRRGREKEANTDCNIFSTKYQKFIDETSQSGDIVLIANRLTYYFAVNNLIEDEQAGLLFKNPTTGQPISRETALNLYAKEIDDFALKLAQKNVNMVIFAPLPEFGINGGTILCSPEWFRPILHQHCESDKEILRKKRAPIMKKLNILARENSNIFIWDNFNFICPDNKCKRLKGKSVTFYDNNHLTNLAVESLYNNFVAFLTSNSLIVSSSNFN